MQVFEKRDGNYFTRGTLDGIKRYIEIVQKIGDDDFKNIQLYSDGRHFKVAIVSSNSTEEVKNAAAKETFIVDKSHELYGSLKRLAVMSIGVNKSEGRYGLVIDNPEFVDRKNKTSFKVKDTKEGLVFTIVAKQNKYKTYFCLNDAYNIEGIDPQFKETDYSKRIDEAFNLSLKKLRANKR